MRKARLLTDDHEIYTNVRCPFSQHASTREWTINSAMRRYNFDSDIE